jgi:anti-anti-sigma factor
MMRRACKIAVHEDNDIDTIEIHDDLTASAQKDMDAAFQETCGRNPRNILLKFDTRSRINSTGIAIIINLVIDSREKDCKVYLTGMSQHFRKIFGMVGLTRYADIVESVDEIDTEAEGTDDT